MVIKAPSSRSMVFHDLASRGYRMPAEWEPHRGTWVSYPHRKKSFLQSLSAAQEAWADMVMHLSRVEEVHINVNDQSMETEVRKKLEARKVRRNVVLHRFPTDDAWCRDHGAIIVKHQKSGKLAATDWIFNGWGGKYPASRDNRIAKKMAESLGMEAFSFPFILEGGSIDVNGEGLLLTTEQCLLNKNRNAHLTRREIEKFLYASLGVRQVLWLKGGIDGDDTDGHVDDLARFTDPRTIVTVVERDPQDVNYAILRENLSILKSLRSPSGRPFRIVELPMPDPQYRRRKERLPASYANFYVANGIVILPVFQCRQDREAAQIIASLFPGRKIVPVAASDIIVGLGACHCLTQQIPL